MLFEIREVKTGWIEHDDIYIIEADSEEEALEKKKNAVYVNSVTDHEYTDTFTEVNLALYK